MTQYLNCHSPASILLGVTIFLSSNVSAQTAQRFLQAEIYIPGTQYEVAIMVNGESGNIAVRETPPVGWIISNVSNGGKISSGIITWELSFTGSTKLIYKVTPPRNATEIAIFSGKVKETDISGISTLYYEKKSGISLSSVEKLAGGVGATEGPVWHKDGYLLFCGGGKIMQWSPNQNATVWDNIGANGLTFDREGRLLCCEPFNRSPRVIRIEQDGKISVIADNYQGKKFNTPDDLCMRSDGMIFFTDPDYTILTGQKSEMPSGVYCVIPGNKPVLLLDDLMSPNGLAFSPDESKIYIADTEESMPDQAKPSYNGVRVYDVANDGTLSNGVLFAHSASDGLKVDREGNVYLAIGAIAIYSPQGNLIEIIQIPEKALNFAFGDDDNKTLYITAGTSLYRVRVRIPGVPVWKSSGLLWENY